MALPRNLTELHARVEAAVGELTAVTQRIQILSAENEGLRREIGVLQKQVAQRPPLTGGLRE
jgi:hypothetical protein